MRSLAALLLMLLLAGCAARQYGEHNDGFDDPVPVYLRTDGFREDTYFQRQESSRRYAHDTRR